MATPAGTNADSYIVGMHTTRDGGVPSAHLPASVSRSVLAGDVNPTLAADYSEGMFTINILGETHRGATCLCGWELSLLDYVWTGLLALPAGRPIR